MAFPKHIWNQLKNLTVDRIIAALSKDGWIEEGTRGATRGFYRNNQRVVIHYHAKKTYGPRLLKGLLKDIGWSTQDLKRLKLIK